MNRVLQEEQMDIIVRFWDDDEGMVKTRYLDSKFLKRPNCQNLLEKLLDGISFLPLCRMLQLSMDGPNVNWSVFKMLVEHSSEHDFGTLINIGNCGLHIVHGAFQTGVQSTGSEGHVAFISRLTCKKRDLYQRMWKYCFSHEILPDQMD